MRYWLWRRLAAAALIRPIAWKLPYAASVASKQASKKARKQASKQERKEGGRKKRRKEERKERKKEGKEERKKDRERERKKEKERSWGISSPSHTALSVEWVTHISHI